MSISPHGARTYWAEIEKQARGPGKCNAWHCLLFLSPNGLDF